MNNDLECIAQNYSSATILIQIHLNNSYVCFFCNVLMEDVLNTRLGESKVSLRHILTIF